MSSNQLTHVAGTFVIQADGAFLNGAGLGQGEDRTTTVPKTLMDGKSRIPYVSAQSWRHWLRTTLIEETGWEASEIRAIKFNAKGNTSKVSGEVNPVDFAEDDLFGYMRTAASDAVEAQSEDGEISEEDGEQSQSAPSAHGSKVKAVMRPSPFASSILMGIRKANQLNTDNGYVFPKYDGAPEEGVDHHVTPLPYSTKFYVANLQAVFCLDYSRLGVFRNVGDRIELAEEFIKPSLGANKIKVTEDLGDKGKVYELSDGKTRKSRATELLKALAILRGGAKQAQFGTPVSPVAIVAAGLSCGNAIFNHLFNDDPEQGLKLNTELLEELVNEYQDRITTPVYIGIRKDTLSNEEDIYALAKKLGEKKMVVTTPREAMAKLTENLQ